MKINDLKAVRFKRIRPNYHGRRYKVRLTGKRAYPKAILALAVIVLFIFFYLSPFSSLVSLGLKIKKQSLLVGFQNSAELRPTGGFWGSFGIWKVNKNIFDSEFYFETNPYKNDNLLLSKSSEPLPLPLKQTYPDRPQSFVNATWQVNFPQTAKSLQWYLSQGWGEKVDGTLAVSSLAIIDLLKLTGPIVLPDGTFVDDRNFTRVMSQKIDIEYWEDPSNIVQNEPKTILKDLSPIILQRLRSMGIVELSRFLMTQMKKGRLLAFSNDRSEQKLMRKLGISGEIQSQPKDYLLVNNANLNGGKSSLNVTQRVDYDTSGNSSKLTITREMNDEWPGVLNRNYTRIYVPLGSKLEYAELDSEDISDNIDVTQENAKTCFGLWFSVAPAEKKILQLKYTLPFEKLKSKDYNLTYQKQPGTFAEDLKIKFKDEEIYNSSFDQLTKTFRRGRW